MRCTRARSAFLRQPLSSAVPSVQVLVLAPTREIALQGSEAVGLAAAALPPPGLSCGTFIGGLPVEEDEKQLRRQATTAAAAASAAVRASVLFVA
jgi:superfamily II DNA/RNA helicase